MSGELYGAEQEGGGDGFDEEVCEDVWELLWVRKLDVSEGILDGLMMIYTVPCGCYYGATGRIGSQRYA